MFAPDASAAGSEAKALNAAAQKVLSVEIEQRATRLSHAPNDQIVLANDGAIRWLGAVVGKLIAGDDTLRPRVRIIADEHLTGPARELVQTRLDLGLKSQVERLLAPLFTLTAAEDVTGMARGIAFQLVEAIGVLERQKVAEEVKGLDQPSRATLRKYGVRFGAYHIYVPALMKPAPRALATQLWALKHEAPDAHGIAELLHLAASGRTSIPVDKETPTALYRTAGYRIAGDRAIRVDILERLADLIRPALAWREGSLQQKPDGAFDGRGFTVTGAMTSLTGASGEDFASILRALGYRMDRRPKPPEAADANKPPEAEKLADAAPEAAAQAETAPENAPADAAAAEAASAEQVEAAAPIADVDLVPQIAPEKIAAAPAEQLSATTPAEQAAPETPAEQDVGAEAAKPSEPETVEVWRPAGRAERRPKPQQQHRRPHPRRPQAAAPAAESAPTEASAAPAAPADAAQQPPRRERPERDRQERRERQERQPRMERQDSRSQRGERDDRGPRRPRRGRDEGPGRAEREEYYARPHGGDRRNKEPDPNSPFAKLAALKQQLEQNKEPS
jgi:ATP-dependent RNA helicase SUPV3L1/SUV3